MRTTSSPVTLRSPLLNTGGWWLLPLAKLISNDYSKYKSDRCHPLNTILKFWDFNRREILTATLMLAFCGEECEVPCSSVILPTSLFLFSGMTARSHRMPGTCACCLIKPLSGTVPGKHPDRPPLTHKEARVQEIRVTQGRESGEW